MSQQQMLAKMHKLMYNAYIASGNIKWYSWWFSYKTKYAAIMWHVNFILGQLSHSNEKCSSLQKLVHESSHLA